MSDKRVQMCGKCKNHNANNCKRGHVCPNRFCACLLCSLTKEVREVMGHQQNHWRRKKKMKVTEGTNEEHLQEYSTLLEENQMTKTPTCARCRIHDRFVVRKKHICPFDNCRCSLCHMIVKRREIIRHQQRIRRFKITTKNTTSDENGKIVQQEFACKRILEASDSFKQNQLGLLLKSIKCSTSLRNFSTHDCQTSTSPNKELAPLGNAEEEKEGAINEVSLPIEEQSYSMKQRYLTNKSRLNAYTMGNSMQMEDPIVNNRNLQLNTVGQKNIEENIFNGSVSNNKPLMDSFPYFEQLIISEPPPLIPIMEISMEDTIDVGYHDEFEDLDLPPLIYIDDNSRSSMSPPPLIPL